MKLAKAVAVGAILAAGVAYAQQEPTDPNAIARETLMKTLGMNAGVLGNMASGKDPFDAAKAETAKAALVDAAGKIEATFAEQGATDPASRAKPDVWTGWDEFLVKAKALGDGAAALDVATVESVGAGMGVIGSACSDCHKTYRTE